MDYKELLLKYIGHVWSEEGVDFIESVNGSNRSDVVFTEDEQKELEILSKEAQERYNP